MTRRKMLLLLSSDVVAARLARDAAHTAFQAASTSEDIETTYEARVRSIDNYTRALERCFEATVAIASGNVEEQLRATLSLRAEAGLQW